MKLEENIISRIKSLDKDFKFQEDDIFTIRYLIEKNKNQFRERLNIKDIPNRFYKNLVEITSLEFKKLKMVSIASSSDNLNLCLKEDFERINFSRNNSHNHIDKLIKKEFEFLISNRRVRW